MVSSCSKPDESQASLVGPKSSLALDAAPYHAVDETIEAVNTIGGSEAANALSMLSTLKATATVGPGSALECHKPAKHPKHPAAR